MNYQYFLAYCLSKYEVEPLVWDSNKDIQCEFLSLHEPYDAVSCTRVYRENVDYEFELSKVKSLVQKIKTNKRG
jgi:hypothetical protein